MPRYESAFAPSPAASRGTRKPASAPSALASTSTCATLSGQGTRHFAPSSSQPPSLGRASVRGRYGSESKRGSCSASVPSALGLSISAGKQLRLLRVRAEVRDRVPEQSRCEDRERDREVAERELLGDERAGERAARAAAAELLGESVRDQAELVRAREHVVRDLARLVGFAGARADLALREFADGVADQRLLFRGLEVDHAPSMADSLA